MTKKQKDFWGTVIVSICIGSWALAGAALFILSGR